MSILAIGAVRFGFETQNYPLTSYVHIFMHPKTNHDLDNLMFHNILSLIPIFLFLLFLGGILNIRWNGYINI
jgi:hypothetical protein